MADFPPPISLSNLEGLIEQYPEVYDAFRNFVVSYNTQQNFLQEQFDYGAMPLGPRSVTATQLGGTIQINWGSDLGGSPIVVYRVYRADAGTRSSPTTPNWLASLNVANMPAQPVNCLTGTDYTTGAYTWIDRNFTITELDPANPTRKTYWVSSVDNQDRESIPVQATNSPIEVLTNGPGDQGGGDPTKNSPLNKLQNSAFLLTTGTIGNGVVPNGGDSVSSGISAASNAAPIQITTNSPHGLATNDKVQISNTTGNTAANGYWTITKVDASNFTLNGSTGNGVFGASDGYFTVAKAGTSSQPAPTGAQDANNNYGFGPWYSSTYGFQPAGLVFTDDGTNFTQEVSLVATAALSQEITTRKFRPGMRLTFSVYVRIPTQPTNSTLQFNFKDGFGGTRTIDIASSVFTSTYSRVQWNFALGTSSNLLYIKQRMSIYNNKVSGTGQTMFIMRPMLVLGDSSPGWTNASDVNDAPGSLTSGADPTISTWTRTISGVYRDASVSYV